MKKDGCDNKCCGAKEKGKGIHISGEDERRACWVVAGTLFSGNAQGVLAQEMSSCNECDYYMTVLKEEGASYINAFNLLSHLN